MEFGVYRELVRAARPLFEAEDWSRLKGLLREGIAKGAYAQDAHGIDTLDRCIRTGTVIVEKTGLKKASLLTALFDPMVQQGLIAPEQFRDKFGEDAAGLIQGMCRVKELYSKHDSIADENFRKLLVSFAEDVRVIICLIADRYVLMKMLAGSDDNDYRLHVTEECRLLYIPMAHRLGLYAIKSEMEDMVVKYEHRDVYDDIARQLNETKRAREAYIQSFIGPVKAKLEEAGLKFTIKGRTKSISSIWNKMKAQNTTLDHIYDLFAIRIILDSPADKEKAQCWQVYSIVTDMYQPNPKRLRDWLSVPKSNGYESLHITVNGPENRWVEIQIRTRRMDDIAERGLAAHWSYKGIKSEGAADSIMAGIREILEHNTNPDELRKDFALDMYQEEIFVFTPNGEVRQLPKGATVLDFAFSIHSKLGLTCVGARVGGRNVRISHKLQSGDTVEVLTSSTQTPKQDWLNIAVTSRARMRIRQGINEIRNREAQAGKELLQRRFKNRKIDISESDMSRLIVRMGFKGQTPFFHALMEDEISVDDVLKVYEEMHAQGEQEVHSAQDFDIEKTFVETEKKAAQDSDVLVIGDNLTGIDFKMAGCCHPIYGDDVTGFVSINGGIRIHRSSCPNLMRMRERYPYRIVRARWSGKSGSQYSITLNVVGQDDIGIVSNISSIINKEPDTLLRSISIDSNGGLFQGHLTVLVSDLSSLDRLVKKLKQIKGVREVERIN
ncbi:MAG: bifunctional (p)ppGpp synthetase/guanosine-3',5'-bis(diphosphate) 3'-pyrophosphohydrolase [Bacteroidaceae bacterium]|nr:bifunctional (p)ppGpp synthetase/guanosine-3',5'-bis(diphosphate) 3'-pyrophosphohydrolase [Bacteroidaceae bacterium]MBR6856323.1 bifunctional (p)ppGpp synthetase/guanosine-3',5'-bis(diphosphate) 3'-pyrophosphohydrolase [Bacteroidaceae bacterium]